MKFLLDENIPFRLKEFLSEKGFESEHIYDKNWGGKEDIEIAKWVAANELILLTFDDDFIALWQNIKNLSVIIFKVKPTSYDVVSRAFNRVISEVSRKKFKHALIIINSVSIKLRSKKQPK